MPSIACYSIYMLESRSQFLFILLAVSILASVVLTYWNTMVRKDFMIINDIEDVSLDTVSSEAP
mgnify:CR=1